MIKGLQLRLLYVGDWENTACLDVLKIITSVIWASGFLSERGAERDIICQSVERAVSGFAVCLWSGGVEIQARFGVERGDSDHSIPL